MTIDSRVDLKFWAILPALNINLHHYYRKISLTIEVEWLCFGLYIDLEKGKVND